MLFPLQGWKRSAARGRRCCRTSWVMSAATGCMKDPSHASGPGTAARRVSHPAHSPQLANQFDFLSGPGKEIWLFHPTTRCLSDQVHPRSITYHSITFTILVSHQGHQVHPQLCKPGVLILCTPGLHMCLIWCTRSPHMLCTVEDAPGARR